MKDGARVRARALPAPRMYTVGQLGKLFGISRSALLYYDSIGLLSPSRRSASNYRLYSVSDVRRMKRIRTYREAGLPLETIAQLLRSGAASAPMMLERHLLEVNREIAKLRQQQRVIARLLNDLRALRASRAMTKGQWVALLAATGLNEDGMRRWHAEFEKMSPEAHQDFLESLGIPQNEIALIRRLSGGKRGPDQRQRRAGPGASQAD